jgi:hypothetical protein
VYRSRVDREAAAIILQDELDARARVSPVDQDDSRDGVDGRNSMENSR